MQMSYLQNQLIYYSIESEFESFNHKKVILKEIVLLIMFIDLDQALIVYLQLLFNYFNSYYLSLLFYNLCFFFDL